MRSDYQRITAAIHYIEQNIERQPTVAEVARHLQLSPSHFQHLFKRWAGVSPKRFLQFLTVEQAKAHLRCGASILDTSLSTGLSGPGRLHDQFVNIEAVSPGEYKGSGDGLALQYGSQSTPFGRAFIACSERGVVSLEFCDADEELDAALTRLQLRWPGARVEEKQSLCAALVRDMFGHHGGIPGTVKVLVRGTNFQVKVWQALLRIPEGRFVSYRQLAELINKPSAARAVANAVGANPVAWLIPCHRVLRSNGAIGGYRWGSERKRAILTREQLVVSH